MLILASSKKTVWLFVTLFLLDLSGPAIALKCYSCNGRVDCIVNGNLNREVECEKGYNACLTVKGENDDKISKFCWMTKHKKSHGPGYEPDTTHYYCYKDFCNKGDYKDAGRFISESDSSIITPFFKTVAAMISVYTPISFALGGGACPAIPHHY